MFGIIDKVKVYLGIGYDYIDVDAEDYEKLQAYRAKMGLATDNEAITYLLDEVEELEAKHPRAFASVMKQVSAKRLAKKDEEGE